MSRGAGAYAVAMGVLGLAAALAGGCQKPGPQSDYQAFRGTVKAIDEETGEVFIRADRTPEGWQPGRDLPCVVTKDSEVYINDRFSQVREVRVADAADVVGYRDKDRFVVSFLTINRDEPPASAPALVAASQASSQPSGKDDVH